ncbi:hypothetical protein A9G22_10820 [Gilliamella sp. App2-1]|nr:hypothetical protein A9G23_09585 [Gilliamella apicola]OCG20229.1 hypothetical protein A9G22_10820 [Gilliamella apicola]
MLEIDKKARAKYERTVNIAYYTSSKFAKDVALNGALSSVTTTVTNIFFTTQKMLGKMIRGKCGGI